jgi:hypothetical protein
MTPASQSHALYFECHVTIDPVAESELEALSQGASFFGFKLVKLLMAKGAQEFLSDRDSFMTSHSASSDYENLATRMLLLCNWLKDSGYGLRRYKIESVVMDSRNHDTYSLLG